MAIQLYKVLLQTVQPCNHVMPGTSGTQGCSRDSMTFHFLDGQPGT